jgi:hypothetical protein
MTLAEYLSALSARVAAIETRLAEPPAALGATPEHTARLDRAIEDIASLRDTVVATSAAAESAHALADSMRSDLDAVRRDVATVKDAQGDLAALALP